MLEEALPHFRRPADRPRPGAGAGDNLAFIQQLFEARSERQAGFTVRVPPPTRGQIPLALPPLILDADGLNILSRLQDWAQRLPAGTILTPHQRDGAPAGEDTAALQADRRKPPAVTPPHGDTSSSSKALLPSSPRRTDGPASLRHQPGVGERRDVLAGVIVALQALGLGAFEAQPAGRCTAWPGKYAREQFAAQPDMAAQRRARAPCRKRSASGVTTVGGFGLPQTLHSRRGREHGLRKPGPRQPSRAQFWRRAPLNSTRR